MSERVEEYGRHGRRILAIDPGPVQSAYVSVRQVDEDTLIIIDKDIINNADVLTLIRGIHFDVMLIEHLEYSFGKHGIGKSVTETVFWTGRFYERFEGQKHRLRRKDIVKTLCDTPSAGDSAVIQALADRYALHQPNRGKGTKKAPGYFFGFHDDIWQAFAVVAAWVAGCEVI